MNENMIRYLVKLGYSEPMLRSLTTSQLSNLYHARLYLENKENWFFQSVLSGFCEHDYRVWSFNGGKNARRAVRLQNVRYRGYDFALRWLTTPYSCFHFSRKRVVTVVASHTRRF